METRNRNPYRELRKMIMLSEIPANKMVGLLKMLNELQRQNKEDKWSDIKRLYDIIVEEMK